MAISTLFNFLLNNPNAPVPFPWERIIDIQRRLIYYRHNGTGGMIFDARRLVNVGGAETFGFLATKEFAC
ncbi:hypothetical protein CR513_41591, partial [Mucuna pruriens]